MLLILQLDDFERIIFSFEPSLVPAIEWSSQHMDLVTFVFAEIFAVNCWKTHNTNYMACKYATCLPFE